MTKKKTNNEIRSHEMNFITARESVIDSIIGQLKNVATFKVGDYLIAFEPANQWHKRRQVVNSYGAPKKFKVIHTCKYGIPYIKELNRNGRPVGNLLCPLRFDGDSRLIRGDIEFEVDPDYTDAIILMDEDNFNAAQKIKEKSDTFRAITEHNKNAKILLKEDDDVIKFIHTLKVGDVYYRSIKTHITILTLDPRIGNTRYKGFMHSDFGTAQDSKGNIFNLNLYTFKWSALYRSRPRSYKSELKDPN